ETTRRTGGGQVPSPRLACRFASISAKIRKNVVASERRERYTTSKQLPHQLRAGPACSLFQSLLGGNLPCFDGPTSFCAAPSPSDPFSPACCCSSAPSRPTPPSPATRQPARLSSAR